MAITSEQLWDALYRIGSEDGTADEIAPAVTDLGPANSGRDDGYGNVGNFARKNEALKGNTPAMASGLSDHVWTIDELIERAAGA